MKSENYVLSDSEQATYDLYLEYESLYKNLKTYEGFINFVTVFEFVCKNVPSQYQSLISISFIRNMLENTIYFVSFQFFVCSTHVYQIYRPWRHVRFVVFNRFSIYNRLRDPNGKDVNWNTLYRLTNNLNINPWQLLWCLSMDQYAKNKFKICYSFLSSFQEQSKLQKSYKNRNIFRTTTDKHMKNQIWLLRDNCFGKVIFANESNFLKLQWFLRDEKYIPPVFHNRCSSQPN